MKKLFLILVLAAFAFCVNAQVYKYKLYSSKSEYTKELESINTKMGFPSHKGTRLINGKWKELTFDRVMTRTWANENPRITLLNKYPLPIEGVTKLIGLVDYDKTWYPVEEIIEPIVKEIIKK